MLETNVGFHIVFSCERLLTQRTPIRLRSMYRRVVPTVAHRFATYFTCVKTRRLRDLVKHLAIIRGGCAWFYNGGYFRLDCRLFWLIERGWLVRLSLFLPRSWNRERTHHHHLPKQKALSQQYIIFFLKLQARYGMHKAVSLFYSVDFFVGLWMSIKSLTIITNLHSELQQCQVSAIY